VESFLEVPWHVVRKLTNAVEGCVSNLRVRVLQVLDNDGYHRADFVYFVNVLTNLGEGHNPSVLVPPVRVIGDGVLDKLSNQRKHYSITNSGN